MIFPVSSTLHPAACSVRKPEMNQLRAACVISWASLGGRTCGEGRRPTVKSRDSPSASSVIGKTTAWPRRILATRRSSSTTRPLMSSTATPRVRNAGVIGGVNREFHGGLRVQEQSTCRERHAALWRLVDQTANCFAFAAG